MTLHQIIQFFIKYKYQAIFPVAVAEGPIITIISGFLVSLGYLDLLPALLVVFLGDAISDTAYYFAGRGGRHMIGYLKFTRISEEQIQKLENRFELSSWKTMIVSKISYGLGSAFMATSGASGMPFGRFLEYTLSLDFIRSSLLLAIGFYFGKAAVHLGPTYLKYYMIAVIILVPAIYFIYRKKLRNPKNK
jgi:membrane protein DedA with SNARE-associated domain